MSENSCIFCNIANGEIKSSTLYEDKDFRVILDISPASKGHALILLKGHYADLLEVPDEISAKILPLAKKVGDASMKALKADGFNVLINTKESAGQTVFHCHIHIIPRFAKEKSILTWDNLSYKEGEQEEILKNIKKELKA